MTALEELTSITNTLVNQPLEQWRSAGKKVVGFFCSYVPEELLCAGDILPYRMRAVGCEDTSSADVYMAHVNCTFSRSCLEFALTDKYPFLDGLVFTWSCDHLRRVYDILREYRPNNFSLLHFIDVPHKTTDEAVSMFAEELAKFKSLIESTFDTQITDDRLRDAIVTYNETRTLLRELYELRTAKNPPISGAESLNVVIAGTVIPKVQYNELLKALLEELRERDGITNYKARLVLAGGGGCDDAHYLEIMEELGALVVNDTICFGSRSFMEPVEIEGDLLTALARSYLKRPSCPRMPEELAKRSTHVADLVKHSNADGVIFQRIRYCDLWGGDQLDVSLKMKEASIPMLILEREYRTSAVGQLKTRVQAFLERIGR